MPINQSQTCLPVVLLLGEEVRGERRDNHHAGAGDEAVGVDSE